MDVGNQARGYAFFANILRGQQADPYCPSCNSFVKTLAAVRDGLAAFEREHAGASNDLPQDLVRLFSDARAGIAALQAPESTMGQKKAGNCRLPEGACFLKSSLALLHKI